MAKIDLNCDMGESFGAYTIGADEAAAPYITSANVACGFHAGDPMVMERTVALLKSHGVAIGAHPGFPDLLGFGRRNLAASPKEAKAYVQYQIGALQAFCKASGSTLQHVKPHGALYNMAGKDMDLALAMAQVIHTDLTVANVSSWSYWTTCERERWSQKSRFYLIRLNPTGGDYGELTEGGTYTTSKNLWVLVNYSRFIRPGYKRISATPEQQGSDFLASAYVSPENDKLVVVYVNLKKESVKVDNTITGAETPSNAEQYVTSEGRDLRRVGAEQLTVVPARSVTTIVYDI